MTTDGLAIKFRTHITLGHVKKGQVAELGQSLMERT